ncbi:MAG: glucokinase [Chitinophagaceae bacterium]
MNNQNKIQLALPRIIDQQSNNILVLAADIGGTKTNLGLFFSNDGAMELKHEASYHSNQFSSFNAIMQQFLAETKNELPDRISIGVSGPILNNKVHTTNLLWEIESNDLLKETKVKEVALINDLEATAYGLAGLNEDDIISIHNKESIVQGNCAIIAPGTGLGEAGLFWDGKYYHPFATEGGHCNFAPQTDLDIELYRYLKQSHEQVSWEHVACGPGIFNIYKFLRDVKKMQEPPWLKEELNEDDPSKIIDDCALKHSCELCEETMQLFARYLARESCNLVLKLKATGGLFFGGGIPPKIKQYLETDDFYKAFQQSDRMEILMQSIPIKIIMNNKTALIGAAYFGAFGNNQL